MEHSNVIRLGGREFAGVTHDVTAAQEEFISAHLRRAGALEALNDPSIPADKRADEMLTRIQLAGATFQILAGCLVETVPSPGATDGSAVRKKWKRGEAERNAAFFSELCDADSRALIHAEIVGVVLGFLRSAAQSSKTSRNSSAPKNGESPTASAAPETTETSRESSAPSPATTSTASAA